MNMTLITVGKLRSLLEGIPDNMEITDFNIDPNHLKLIVREPNNGLYKDQVIRYCINKQHAHEEYKKLCKNFKTVVPYFCPLIGEAGQYGWWVDHAK